MKMLYTILYLRLTNVYQHVVGPHLCFGELDPHRHSVLPGEPAV